MEAVVQRSRTGSTVRRVSDSNFSMIVMAGLVPAIYVFVLAAL